VPPGALTGYTNIKLRGYVTFNQGGTLVSQAHDAYSNIDPSMTNIAAFIGCPLVPQPLQIRCGWK
jgi:hypothetical protein